LRARLTPGHAISEHSNGSGLCGAAEKPAVTAVLAVSVGEGPARSWILISGDSAQSRSRWLKSPRKFSQALSNPGSPVEGRNHVDRGWQCGGASGAIFRANRVQQKAIRPKSMRQRIAPYCRSAWPATPGPASTEARQDASASTEWRPQLESRGATSAGLRWQTSVRTRPGRGTKKCPRCAPEKRAGRPGCGGGWIAAVAAQGLVSIASRISRSNIKQIE